ncbi:hypothetical protein MRX96_043964 [Rhipicephalus microplus]
MIHCGSRISLDNVPFRIVKETVKVCIFGTEYYKKTQEKKKEQVDVPQPCGQTREGRLKADKAKELQEALDAEQQTVAKETRVYVRIADCSSHQNHGFEDMEAFSQNRDKAHSFMHGRWQ